MKVSDDLRRAVLQAAIQGKLTVQRAKDGTADELLEGIRDLSATLQPSKSDIVRSAMNFPIPRNWCFAEMNEIFRFVDYRGMTPIKSEEGVSLITASNVRKGYMDYTRKEYISHEEYCGRLGRGVTEKGDLIFTTEAPMGNVCICEFEKSSCGQRIITFKEYAKKTVVPKLYMYFILSDCFQQQLLNNCTGTTAKGIKAEKLKHFLIPLPPFAEQHRIVEAVDALMSKIDDLDKAETELETMKKNFPVDLRNSLLQAAIQGKLTEQRPEDGSAEELLKKIRVEKEKLIAEGKIRPEKALKPITDDEKPFEIPENWVWCRLGYVCESNIGLTYSPAEISEKGTLVLRSSNIQHGKMNYSDNVYVSKIIPDSARIRKGDILICVRNGSRKLVGKSAIVDRDGMAFGAFMAKICSEYVSNRYIQYYIESHVFRGRLDSVSTETINQITQKMLKCSLFPLPPLAEQHRIVERLDELLPLCEAMKGE